MQARQERKEVPCCSTGIPLLSLPRDLHGCPMSEACPGEGEREEGELEEGKRGLHLCQKRAYYQPGGELAGW